MAILQAAEETNVNANTAVKKAWTFVRAVEAPSDLKLKTVSLSDHYSCGAHPDWIVTFLGSKKTFMAVHVDSDDGHYSYACLNSGTKELTPDGTSWDSDLTRQGASKASTFLRRLGLGKGLAWESTGVGPESITASWVFERNGRKLLNLNPGPTVRLSFQPISRKFSVFTCGELPGALPSPTPRVLEEVAIARAVDAHVKKRESPPDHPESYGGRACCGYFYPKSQRKWLLIWAVRIQITMRIGNRDFQREGPTYAIDATTGALIDTVPSTGDGPAFRPGAPFFEPKFTPSSPQISDSARQAW